MDRRMELGSCSFLMEVTIQGILRMIRLKELGGWCIRMAILIMESGKMIRRMDMASIHRLAEGSTKDIGKTTSDTARERNHGKMGPSLKDCTSSTRRAETENSFTATAMSILASSKRAEERAKES